VRQPQAQAPAAPALPSLTGPQAMGADGKPLWMLAGSTPVLSAPRVPSPKAPQPQPVDAATSATPRSGQVRDYRNVSVGGLGIKTYEQRQQEKARQQEQRIAAGTAAFRNPMPVVTRTGIQPPSLTGPQAMGADGKPLWTSAGSTPVLSSPQRRR
jgi:hypothetical protein